METAIILYKSIITGMLWGAGYCALWSRQMQKFVEQTPTVALNSEAQLKIQLLSSSIGRLLTILAGIILSTLIFRVNLIIFTGSLIVTLIVGFAVNFMFFLE